MLTYRKASESDMDFLLKLRESAMREHVEAAGIEYDEVKQRGRVLFGFDYARIIVFNGQDIGLLKIDKESTPWNIMQIQLLPQYRGRGIGSTVLEEIVDGAVKSRVDVKLSVYKNNPALELYKRKGFIITGEDEHSFFMRRFVGGKSVTVEPSMDRAPQSDEPVVDGGHKKYLIGFVICLSFLFISTFMPWGTFKDYVESRGGVVSFTLTGWKGYVENFHIKVANWFAVLLAFFNGLLVVLAYFKLWKAKLFFYIPAAVVCGFHFFTTLYLRQIVDRASEYRLEPGYFLFIAAFIGLHVVFYNYIKRGKEKG